MCRNSLNSVLYELWTVDPVLCDCIVDIRGGSSSAYTLLSDNALASRRVSQTHAHCALQTPFLMVTHTNSQGCFGY